MTVAPLIAMKSSQVKSFDAVGRELDRRAHTYANDVDQSGRHIGYRCRAEDERPVPLEGGRAAHGGTQDEEEGQGKPSPRDGVHRLKQRCLGREDSEEFLDRSINWFGARYGYENLLAAQIHLDEAPARAYLDRARNTRCRDGV